MLEQKITALEKRVETLEAEKREIVSTIQLMADFICDTECLAEKTADLLCELIDKQYPNNSAAILEKVEAKRDKLNTDKSKFKLFKAKD